MNKQSGFTLIELVIVVVLLATLASVALPRFLDITDSAHEANISGTAGALGSAMSIAHAKWLASGQPTTLKPIAGLDYTGKGHIDMGFSIYGWPHAATDGGANLSKSDILGSSSASNNQICAQIATNLLSASSVSFGSSDGCTQEYCAKYDKPNCIFYYQKDQSKSRKIFYNTSSGQVTKGFF